MKDDVDIAGVPTAFGTSGYVRRRSPIPRWYAGSRQRARSSSANQHL
ncbi:putative amidase AmiA2 domain protein [Mycobacterium xenopi 3993]|nr:putative amidase AmiA2 domain protein [Mycobacterium xenopi 3993]